MAKWTFVAVGVGLATGMGLIAAANSADGLDLRQEGGDIASILRDRSLQAESRQTTVDKLQKQIDQLTAESKSSTVKKENRRIQDLSDAAGRTPLTGPGVRVTLNDAPRSVEVPGLDPNLLVVHQQDIQAVVNALWAGGADAITLQGQRIGPGTAVKCVGNTVVIHGVPYAPPYVIEAIGPSGSLLHSLDISPEVSTFIEYSQQYKLVYESRIVSELKMPAAPPVALLAHARITD